LADPPGAAQEVHPTDGLDQDDATERRDDQQQFARRAASHDRRDAVVDATLHEQRHRQPGGVLEHYDDGQQRDGGRVRPQ
jgi:hypothetical protein